MVRLAPSYAITKLEAGLVENKLGTGGDVSIAINPGGNGLTDRRTRYNNIKQANIFGN